MPVRKRGPRQYLGTVRHHLKNVDGDR